MKTLNMTRLVWLSVPKARGAGGGVDCGSREAAAPRTASAGWAATMVLLVDAFWNAPSVFWEVLSSFRRRKVLGAGFTEPLGHDKLQVIEFEIPQGEPGSPGVNQGHRKERTKLYWDLTGQHTVTWKQPIVCLVNGVSTTLKPGSANLYLFPRVNWATPRAADNSSFFCVVDAAFEATKKQSEVLEGDELEVLKAIFLAICNDPRERDALRLPDSSGACSVLAMLVANTKAAIDMCTSIYNLWPELMAQSHLPGQVRREFRRRSRATAAPQPHHSHTTASPRQHHSHTTATAQPQHSRTTAAPQTHHRRTTDAPQTHHKPLRRRTATASRSARRAAGTPQLLHSCTAAAAAPQPQLLRSCTAYSVPHCSRSTAALQPLRSSSAAAPQQLLHCQAPCRAILCSPALPEPA